MPEFVLSMNFAHVPKSGGVIDFADNLSIAMKPMLGDRLTICRPRRRKGRKAQVLARFLSEIALELRYWRTPAVALFPNYFIFPLPFSKLRRVVVVHDLQFRHYPKYTSVLKRKFLDICYGVVKRYADGVAFISAASQRDFLSFYGMPRLQTVIYNPVCVDATAQNETSVSGAPYVIANFHFYPHKNLQKLLECFRAIRAVWPELRLVLTGHRTPEFDLLLGPDPELQGIDHRGFLPKNEVIRLVQGANFFMSMSLFEGFNISAAEATLLGKPLVLSDIPVHRELFADVALLVDPQSQSFAAKQIVEYVTRFEDRGWRHSAHVTPEYAATEYVRLMTGAFARKTGE
ncbi:MAG: glycosyltransferase [Methyloversatilis sp.]|uniref:glycosyltransferase n=1 Tax=Methyloversatilis sp. TaxID=2569862 RepID=UPI002737729E|nr:glycosyltransferase [Methyloversatilis sp.]MDP3873737.1 glycosyltransferase [Methyloversatilis sp.]